ncbi:MAG: hypothetical protein LKE64_01870 [Solobacterium sp.]|jgi:DNA polymerase III epsilon subunit-like protein|nr:hypothetical protein [Solobacterium sp.]MCH4049812.1 hypothetical protein [Solobacterium sp.]MCH4073497.1 hypothetical protein [Solobacterium sp.]MCI1314160.1 hypothetical protein [Solobacterium sp.]MCI1346244.1 hypothetical protein [Solobacterium sp.]
MAVNRDNDIEDTEDEEDEAVELTILNSDERDLMETLRTIVKDTADPNCPIRLYKFDFDNYKVSYTLDGNTNSIIIYTVSKGSARSMVLKRYEGAEITEITKMAANETVKADIVNKSYNPTYFIKLDYGISEPTWFMLSMLKKFYRIICKMSDEDVTECLKGVEADVKWSSYMMNVKFDGPTNLHSMIGLIHKIRPVLLHRLDFLYTHRVIEPCCCQLETKCNEENRCIQENREMSMKCSFRKLRERQGVFGRKKYMFDSNAVNTDSGRILACFPENYTVIDIETTDNKLNDNTSIIELSAVKYRECKEVDNFSTLVQIDNRNSISKEAFKVNKISNEMVRQPDVPTLGEALEKFIAFVGNDILMGYNISTFDLKLIRREVAKYFSKDLMNDSVDIFLYTEYLYKGLLRNLKLNEGIAEHFNLFPDNAHRALCDCYTTNKVYLAVVSDVAEKYINKIHFFDEFLSNKNMESFTFHGIKREKPLYRIVKNHELTKEDYDENSPFYESNVVVTGNLERYSRASFYQLIRNIGGYGKDTCGVSNKTNILVASYEEDEKAKAGNPSNNYKIALEKEIRIYREDEFYAIIDGKEDDENFYLEGLFDTSAYSSFHKGSFDFTGGDLPKSIKGLSDEETNYVKAQKQMRRNIGLPIMRRLVYYTHPYNETSVCHNVISFNANKFEKHGKTFDWYIIKLEVEGIKDPINILGDFFVEMQDKDFLGEMSSSLAEE